MALIAFSGQQQTERQLQELIIDIIDEEGNYFIDQLEINQIVNQNGDDYILSLSIGELDLKEIEGNIEENAFVSDAQVYYDIKGNLQVKLFQAKPIARILDLNGTSRYIDTGGNLLPLNTSHTARVPIVEVDEEYEWENNIRETNTGEDLWSLLLYIEADRFWKAQIAHITLEKDGEVTMLPQVTKQKVLFGEPVDFERKFKKLKLFYTEILPLKGWNTYDYVDLKFKNQIVCK